MKHLVNYTNPCYRQRESKKKLIEAKNKTFKKTEFNINSLALYVEEVNKSFKTYDTKLQEIENVKKI